jgi:hypothetical protein
MGNAGCVVVNIDNYPAESGVRRSRTVVDGDVLHVTWEELGDVNPHAATVATVERPPLLALEGGQTFYLH